MNSRLTLEGILSYAFLIILSAVILTPVGWIIISSFKSSASLFSSEPLDWTALSLDNYRKLFDTQYLQWYSNTLFVASANTLLNLIFVTITAYVFSRYKFKAKRHIMMGILVLQMFPAFLSMTAIYVILTRMALIDSYWGLLIVYSAATLPFNAWLVKGFFDAIPRSLDEAARLDGAGHLRIFLEIILPLAKPILVFIALTSFTAPWMDFILPSIILRSEDKMTLAVGIFGWIQSQSAENYKLFTAGAILVAIPIGSLFILMQKHISKGLTSGAVKG
ncbi:sugar ABC transporter permease [Vibrio parahaemolyticus]|uniref:sugar ABC transporter permease n=1 Tax=Vibrio parahaemolyticus TaxID=670 RepID=UPI00112361D9|nr:sugar ABC transporter permease [Vibrio parahaemolyticus]TOG33108.1 maltose ABC transporter permease [Vibrio parahaemolyticus]HCM1552935.1 sugar ABC transporter permease [Vibrio parahaemolyticus]